MTIYNQLKFPNSSIGNTSIAAGAVSPDKLDSVAQRLGMKNRIINGAMVIDQRNAGASVTPVTGVATYAVDRFTFNISQSSKFSAQQNTGSVTPPAGFTNYLGITSLSSFTPAANDYFQFIHRVEGYNIADLSWGTANAKTVTLSFWVYSSLTGQFGGALRNCPNYTYTYPFSFNVTTANTWQQVSITIVGPNASQGVWTTNNTAGIELVFNLGSGSNYLSTSGWQSGVAVGLTSDNKLVSTNGATFYITGVQLEVGSSATGFEYRQYGQELALCQRYYYKYSANAGNPYANFGIGYATSSTNAFIQIKNPVPMRANSYGLDLSAASTFNYSYGTSPTLIPNAMGIDISVLQLTGSGMTAGYSVTVFGNNNSGAYIGITAEL